MTDPRLLAPLLLSALALALLSCGAADSWTAEVNNTGGSGSSSGGFTGSASGVTAIASGGAGGDTEAGSSSWTPLPLSADEPELIDLWELSDPLGGPSAFLSVETVAPGEMDVDARLAILRPSESEAPRFTAPPPWEPAEGVLLEHSGALGDPGRRQWLEVLEGGEKLELLLALLPASGLVVELIGPVQVVATHRQGFIELCTARVE